MIMSLPRRAGKSTFYRLWEAAKELFKSATPAPALVIPNKPFSRVWLDHVSHVATRMNNYGDFK